MSRTPTPSPFQRVQPALALIAAHLDEALPLKTLSARAGLSPSHLQRTFATTIGESPKQITRRLRLSRGAALLLASDDSVLTIALACGFDSHEGFTRAFTRQFGLSPLAYRQRGFSGTTDAAAADVHAAVVERVGPCVTLFHINNEPVDRPRTHMTYSIVKKQLAPRPVILARRRVKRSEIGATIGATLGDIFQFAQQHGRPLVGHPFTRYIQIGSGMTTLEPGMQIADVGERLVSVADPTRPPLASGGAVEDLLPGGLAATTIHEGPYDKLPDAYAALEIWIHDQGLEPAGAPWEDYITDPAEFPDPKDWRTEICWPVK